MRKLIPVSFVCFAFLTANVIAEKPVIYISPNNDGVQDVLEVPVQIKEKRYVSEWNFVIENENGEIIRTIGNKEKRDNKLTFQSFWKSLVTPKSGVDIPKTVVWNGIMDNGELAPDGMYLYYVNATDDNGNKGATAKYRVCVDNTPPEVDVKQPASKVFGEGSKIQFHVAQTGSKEDSWTAEFVNAENKVVRTLKWSDGTPLDFDWNGTDDNGYPLPDGVYGYRISAVDRAGNVSSPAGISNIIYSAEKPATNIAIVGSRYFSPNGNGKNENIELEVKIPVPDVHSGNKLTGWEVAVFDKKGNVVRSYSGKDDPLSKILFDGKDSTGPLLPDGKYQARVVARYLNGYETVPINSPVFTLDTSAPSAKVTLKSKSFSPDGDGQLDVLKISQSAETENQETTAPVENWVGRIICSDGSVAREYNFGAVLPEEVIWDGLDSSNKIAKDGLYTYELSASDLAGNTTQIVARDINLDTTKTEVLLATIPEAFNPKANEKSRSEVRITPVVKTQSPIINYDFSVVDESSRVVWEQSGTSLPSTFVWNGKNQDGTLCADGKYMAILSTKSANGSEANAATQKFEIDTVAPAIDVQAAYKLFSPDSDTHKDVLPMSVSSTPENVWNAVVYNDKNLPVRTFTWNGTVPSFDWDGTDSSGNVVRDGTYRIEFAATDVAGNSTRAEVAQIVIDNRETKAFVTAEEYAFSPNGDSFKDTQRFELRTTLQEGIESWKFAISTPEGNIVRSWTQNDFAKIPSEIVWNGKDDKGNVVADNVYSGNLKIQYEKGNVVDVTSSVFISCVTPPGVSVSTAPEYFSPDNDGENDDLFIFLQGYSIVPLKNWTFQINDPQNGKPFWTTSGKSAITEKLTWDGRGNNGELVQSAVDYPYVFTVTDTLGMTSKVEGFISIDILVIRDGDMLKMAVPSIIFRADAADFKSKSEVKNGLSPAQIANNERVLKRIAQILNKFKNYTVTIEGHANNVSGTEEEETSTAKGNIPLEPLSQQRAEFVLLKLKSYGVDSARLSALGRGGRRPVVPREDRDNWWKNRRVEFILNK